MERYQLYGGRFTRALIVQMVMAEGGLEYDLLEIDILKNEHRSAKFLALNPAGYVPVLVKPDGEAVIEQRLQDTGPFHLGGRFSLLDIILGFWAESFNFDHLLDPFPAILACLGEVSNRPLLRPYFDELIEWRHEYQLGTDHD